MWDTAGEDGRGLHKPACYLWVISYLSSLLIFIIIVNWLPFSQSVILILFNFRVYYLFPQYIRSYHTIYLREQIKFSQHDLTGLPMTLHYMHIEWGKSTFTVVNIQNRIYSCTILVFINYRYFHMNKCKPTLPPPCIEYIYKICPEKV